MSPRMYLVSMEVLRAHCTLMTVRRGKTLPISGLVIRIVNGGSSGFSRLLESGSELNAKTLIWRALRSGAFFM